RVAAALAGSRPPGWLDVDSGGGEAPDAMALGRLVRAHRLGVRVVRLCASACAHFVLPAGTRRQVAPGALVLFHSTVTLRWRLHDIAHTVGAGLFAGVAADEAAFWRVLGIPGDPAAWDQGALQPTCLIDDPRRPLFDPNRYGIVARVDAYAVSRSLIEHFVGPIEGYWPADEAAMRRDLAALPVARTVRVAWLDRAPLLVPTPYLPRCQAGWAQAG
ncbi:hypothetical protein, partial [Sphingomonas bacterium]|uniref:hypothetical protein n=1 Tax=Sphingomonas bacterium TaxID=1895847 RepID=UPI001C2D2668